MSEQNLEQIKDKLRKLMNHEASAREIGNEAEANAFAAKITSLMLSYEIEIVEMEAHNLGHNDDVEEERFDGHDFTRRHESTWVVYLYHAVAKYNFCKMLLNGNVTDMKILLIGEPMNREVIHYIVGQLIPKFRYIARQEFKVYQGPEKRNTYIRGFLRGASTGIEDKLREEWLAANQQEQVHGLIVRKDLKLDAYMEKHHGQTGYAKQGRGTKGADGHAAGREAGRNMNINTGVRGGSRVGGRLN